MSIAYGTSRTQADLSAVADSSVAQHERLIIQQARKLIEPGSSHWDDILQVGRIGLCKALARYSNPGPVTWAIPWVVGAMKDYLRDATHTIRHPQTYFRAHKSDVDIDTVSLDEYADDDREFGLCYEESLESLHVRLIFSRLNPYDRQLLLMSAAGMTSKEIAAKMHLKRYTVECDLTEARGRLSAALGIETAETVLPQTKICTRCGKELPASAYYTRMSRGKKRLNPHCKSCESARGRRYRYCEGEAI